MKRILFAGGLLALTAISSMASSDYYMVTSPNGVNVRSDGLLGLKSRIIDTLPVDTCLKIVSEVKLDETEVWGHFVYVKVGEKRIGYIRLDNVTHMIKEKHKSKPKP